MFGEIWRNDLVFGCCEAIKVNNCLSDYEIEELRRKIEQDNDETEDRTAETMPQNSTQLTEKTAE
jgi:hypothetical protein